MVALSEREREVVRALIRHGRQREAAASLGISVSTLKNHIGKITRKMELASVLQVAVVIDRQDRPVVRHQEAAQPPMKAGR